jgi:prevent-host-death family protein
MPNEAPAPWAEHRRVIAPASSAGWVASNQFTTGLNETAPWTAPSAPWRPRPILSALLERLEKGETITITRHGRPVARLVQVEARDPAKTRTPIDGIKASRWSLGGLDWKELRDERKKGL